MPLLYGEGSKAFTRLQHEIWRSSNDHTISCWTWKHSVPPKWTSLLAPSPDVFEAAGIFRPSASISVADEVSIYSMTNAGLSIRLPVIYASSPYFVVLQAAPIDRACDYPMLSCIQVRGQPWGTVLYVARDSFPREPVTIAAWTVRFLPQQPLLVMNNQDRGRVGALDRVADLETSDMDYPGDFTVVVVFDTEETQKQWRLREAMSYPYDAFDPLLGTLTLGVANKRASYEVLAACLTMTTRNMRRSMTIVAAAEISNGAVRWFCQIFQPDDPPRTNTPEILHNLKRQIRLIEDEQPGHYREKLDLSAVLDNGHPLQKDRHNSFLHITQGRTSYLSKHNSGGHDAAAGDDSSSADSVDSNVAIASSQKLREIKLSTVGPFHVPEWESRSGSEDEKMLPRDPADEPRTRRVGCRFVRHHGPKGTEEVRDRSIRLIIEDPWHLEEHVSLRSIG